MTIQLKLNSETEALLIAEARAKGVPPETVAEQLLEEALTARPRPQGRMSIEQFHQMLREMAEGSEKLPNLPTESFTRESFYEDLD
jgi:hypothetical protein